MQLPQTLHFWEKAFEQLVFLTPYQYKYRVMYNTHALSDNKSANLATPPTAEHSLQMKYEFQTSSHMEFDRIYPQNAIRSWLQVLPP